VLKMNSITIILMKIEKNPLLYLDEKDLRLLHSFIDGYLICEADNNQNESMMFFESFKNYFNGIYGLRSYFGWCSILRQESHSEEEEAFDKFFELFNAFLLKQNTQSRDGTVIDKK